MIEKLSLNPADIAVITYYRANLAAIRKRFREDDRLKDVTPSTVNTFQGREAQIVVLALFSDLQEEDKADDGLQKPDSTMIDNVLRTIRASGRVVTLHGNPEIDPDKEWKKLNRQPEFLG
ncbi:hypothetical protein FOC1_g10012269 [Fusarium oxysporum f. sp. cubense race 1]|uniref:DNA2/NAM7 helicase-like C-terminal domain-containing protein n=1 Tax=Fusarium oxysporum f. sp. cubense (strain race 1) TaxID=1229664 RepID=N4UG75_FUSC1|nr:hypothetical protein FOC1_g10012269 [Fusarium oxysporum f. sp. cubense race 1]